MSCLKFELGNRSAISHKGGLKRRVSSQICLVAIRTLGIDNKNNKMFFISKQQNN